MHIYHQVTRYDSDSGAPILVWRLKEIRCDFTGEIIDDYNSNPCYELNYNGQNPFGSIDGERIFGMKYSIPLNEFLSARYHFANSKDKNDACSQMMRLLINKEYICGFGDMCRYSRIQTAIRLIDDGTITPEQLYIK